MSPPAARDGLPAAAEQLRSQPEAFGALQTVERKRLGGLLRTQDDTAARSGAAGTAGLWRDVERAEGGVFDAAQASRTRRLEDALMRELAQVYHEPRAARALWERAAREHGSERAAAALARSPEQFGALRSEGGRLTTEVRVHAARAGVTAEAYTAATHADARSPIGPGPAATRQEQRAARDDAARAGVRSRVARRPLAELGTPNLDRVGREIGGALARLAPPELQRLRTVLTAPQVAISQRLTAAVKDLTFGREDGGR